MEFLFWECIQEVSHYKITFKSLLMKRSFESFFNLRRKCGIKRMFETEFETCFTSFDRDWTAQRLASFILSSPVVETPSLARCFCLTSSRFRQAMLSRGLLLGFCVLGVYTCIFGGWSAVVGPPQFFFFFFFEQEAVMIKWVPPPPPLSLYLFVFALVGLGIFGGSSACKFSSNIGRPR